MQSRAVHVTSTKLPCNGHPFPLSNPSFLRKARGPAFTWKHTIMAILGCISNESCCHVQGLRGALVVEWLFLFCVSFVLADCLDMRLLFLSLTCVEIFFFFFFFFFFF